jgi:hypothetical protein
MNKMFYPGRKTVKFFYNADLKNIESEVQAYLDENKIKKEHLVKIYFGGVFSNVSDRIVYHCCVVHE